MEEAWPDVPDWPLGPQIGPLLVSLEVALKVLDETLDEAGTREYLNDAAKVDVVAASVSGVLSLIADLAFECPPPADAPEGLFGPPSRESAWSTVMKKLDRVDNGVRLAADLRSRYDLAVRALGFDLGLVRTRSKRRFDYDRWVRPDAAHRLYAPDRRERYCVFRPKWNTDFGRSGTSISAEVEHRFREVEHRFRDVEHPFRGKWNAGSGVVNARR